MKITKKFDISDMIFRGICLAIIAYPVLFIIQKLFPAANLFSIYHRYLAEAFNYVSTNKIFMSMILISLLFTGSKRLYASVAGEVRQRHLDLEVERWNDTPYIAPLHLYYMTFPPQTFSQSKRSQANDFSYRYTVDHFRNRIYNNVNYSTFEPNKRPTLFQIVGSKIYAEILGYFLGFLFTLIVMAYSRQVTDWYTGWSVILIPVQVFLLRRVYYLVKAIIHSGATYHKIDTMFIDHYGEKEPHVKWIEAFPNQRIGATILKVWKEECLRRQRIYDKVLNRTTSEVPIFDNQALPECPFTDDEIPEWADWAEEHYSVVKEHWEMNHQINQQKKLPLKNEKNNKVVSLSSHRRRKV